MSNLQPEYVFGYGGLILSEGREMTIGVKVEAVPVIIRGFERLWGFTAPQYHLTTVTLRRNENKDCFGVIFPVTNEQLMELDIREEGYARVALRPEQIEFLNPHGSLPAGSVFTYVSDKIELPNEDNPITQSDVDAILTGCIQDYGEDFARNVVRTTTGWEFPWINDREKPRYPWSNHSKEYIGVIDMVLGVVRQKRRNE